jgi:hypothetical protein
MRGLTRHFHWGLFGACSGQPKRVESDKNGLKNKKI